MAGHERIDPTERAHLLDDEGYTPAIFRYTPGPGIGDLVRRYWIPVWSLPAGTSTVQRVLQYPVCLLVISHEYSIMVGPHTGLGRQELSGEGWAVGVMLQPAAGAMLLGGPVSALTDRRLLLDDVPGLEGASLTDRVGAAMTETPLEEPAHRMAITQVEDALRGLRPADDEGLLVNDIVAFVEDRSDVQRVGQICDAFGIGERALQRLTARRIGLSPKWLVQRRRLHEAAERLHSGAEVDLARSAAELGYADQAHFTRDFRKVTGLTPGAFAAERR